MNLVAFNIFIFGLALMYVVGAITYRLSAHASQHTFYRGILMVLLVGCATYFSIAPITLLHMTLSILFLCFCAGFIAPLSTGDAMSKISEGHGSAAAIISFSGGLAMSIWAFVQSNLSITHYEFIKLGLWITVILTIVINVVIIALQLKKTSPTTNT